MALSSIGAATFDPRLAASTSLLTNDGPIFDYLVGVDNNGKLAPTGLATDWAIAPDGLSWTFHLRQGVKFQNGDDFTADDVKFTLDSFVAPDSQSSFAASFRTGISNVEVVDRYTVKVNTKGAWGVFPWAVSTMEGVEGMMLPKNYITQVGWKVFGQKPIGTGPWKLVSSEPNVSYTYETNENYWGRVPMFKTLKVLQVTEESTRIAMLKKGEADAIELSIAAKKQVTDAGLTVKTNSDTWIHNVLLYGTALPQAGPTYNLGVRQAMSLAINRDEVVKYVYDGEAAPSAQFLFTPVTLGFDPNLKPDPYDVNKATQLLKDAGYGNGFTITLYTFPQGGNPELAKLAEVVAGYWDKIGIKTNIVPLDLAAMRAMYNTTPQDPKVIGQASTMATIQRGSSVSQMHLVYHSKDVFRLAQDPQIDQLIDANFNEADVAKVDSNLKKAAQILFDQVRGISVVRPHMLLGMGKNVGDFEVVKGLASWTKMMASATHAQ